MSDAEGIFENERPRLARLAYRMLGSLVDADDVLQDAFLRFARDDRSGIKAPSAYLSSIVVRLCIDRRRTIEARKETYVGPWLPEPIVETTEADPSGRLETAESISLAFLVVLESLSSVERAAYLLRRVFDYGYEEIGAILDKSAQNCRQLVHRAETAIHQRRPRFAPDPREAERMTGAFLEACTSGDLAGLLQLLSADAVVYSDGGGKVPAAIVPIRGADRVARLFLGVTRQAPAGWEARFVLVNGQPGLLVLIAGHVAQVMTMEVVAGRITTCYVIRNPEKLARIPWNQANGAVAN
jgi:RNA polymerase sigma-70 factor, ECF subfamily